jgi:hypothetical protein
MESPSDTPQTGPGQVQPASAREILADHYFQKDLKGQQEWYGKRASKYNRSSQLVALTIIVAGATTSVVQIFNMPWVPVLTAVLGALVAVAESWRRIADYDKTWIAFRGASERMKRERRLFLNGAGAYRNLSDEEAYIRFVEAVEDVIAEEQKLFWQNRSKQEQDSKKPSQSADGGPATSNNRRKTHGSP